jgi:hypothetical protein
VKQADDDSLRKLAARIKPRVIRRCGELLRAIAPAKNQYVKDAYVGGGNPSL